jgi:hypothetical protein
MILGLSVTTANQQADAEYALKELEAIAALDEKYGRKQVRTYSSRYSN